jgi:hypothetical protein
VFRKILWGLILVNIFFPRLTIAASKSGISLTPSYQDIIINDESEKSFDLIIANNTNVDEIFELSVVDFGTLNETGGIAFLTTKTESSEKKYALASWVSLEKNEVIVAPGQEQKIKITILNRESLAPGGHYGAVLATIKTGDPRNQDAVGINQTMASLMYVLKTKGEIFEVVVKDLVEKNNIFKMTNSASISLINRGNVHAIPRGDYEILMGERMVAKGIINESFDRILPESVRVFETKVGKITKWNWPGRYETRFCLRYDEKNDFEVFKNSFFYIGYEGLVLVVVFLVIFLGLTLKLGKKTKL